MKKPNFFLIGAPRCGTTSMAAWLAEHPSFFMSPEKEPHYFNTDHRHSRLMTNFGDYQALFEGATEEHIAIGEASTTYLYSKKAVLNILEYNPDAKFLVMVRNPVEAARSMYYYRCLSAFENAPDFATAWRLQEERLMGREVPPRRSESRRPPYGKLYLLGAQLQRLYSYVPQDRVHVMVFDDLKADPQLEYQRVLRFLGVPDNGRHNFSATNQARGIRSERIMKLMFQLSKLKRRIGINRKFGIHAVIAKIYTRPLKQTPLSPEMRQMLFVYYREDIQLLGRLLERDLTCWYS